MGPTFTSGLGGVEFRFAQYNGRNRKLQLAAREAHTYLTQFIVDYDIIGRRFQKNLKDFYEHCPLMGKVL